MISVMLRIFPGVPAFCCVVIAAMCGGDSAWADIRLEPHKAIYAVTLSPESAGGQIVKVDGVMLQTSERSCDGWIFVQDMKSVFTMADGNKVAQSAMFTSWESQDGRTYQFASQTRTGEEELILRGNASVGADGSGTAVYQKPERVDVTLPAGTMFPMSHAVWLLNEAKAGARSANRIIFSGSDSMAAELFNVFIGDYTTLAEHGTSIPGSLSDTGGWPLTLAVYPLDNSSGIPTVEVYAFQLENGVSPELRMNFGGFGTQFQLQKLELMTEPQCP